MTIEDFEAKASHYHAFLISATERLEQDIRAKRMQILQAHGELQQQFWRVATGLNKLLAKTENAMDVEVDEDAPPAATGVAKEE